MRLRPAEDIDAENSFADWIAEGPKEVVTKQDFLKHVDVGLKQYFQQVVNGVTTLSLLEGHGAGAIRDEVAFCADAGLPSWLEIVKTSSVQVQGAASKAIEEENKRIENAKARRNKLSEQIDIIVSEEKLEQVKAEIAHRNEMMRKKRELDLARINSLLDEIKIKKEIAKIEKDYVVAIHDVDYQIKCQKLENEKVDGKAKLEDIENKRRESEASIRKIEQDIKESQAKIDDILRKGSIWRKLFLNTYFLLGLTVALCVVSYYFIDLYGEEQRELELLRAKQQAEIERQKIKAKELQEEKSRKYREQKEREIARQKAEVTELTLQYEKTYNELKSSYRYYGWRTNSFVTAEKLIRELKHFHSPQDVEKVSVVTGELKKTLFTIEMFDKASVEEEQKLLRLILPSLHDVEVLIGMLPNDFVWGNVTKDKFDNWKSELDEFLAKVTRGDKVDSALVKKTLNQVQKYVEFDYRANALAWNYKPKIVKTNHDLHMLFEDLLRSDYEIIKQLEKKNTSYFIKLRNTLRLFQALKFYNANVAKALLRAKEVCVQVELRPELDFLFQEIKAAEESYVEELKRCINQRTSVKSLGDLTETFLKKVESVYKMYSHHIGETERIRNACRMAYKISQWDVLLAHANSLKKNKKFIVEGEHWEEIAKWAQLNSYASNLISRVNAKYNGLVAAYLRYDESIVPRIDKMELKEEVLSWFSSAQYISEGPKKELIKQIRVNLNVDPLPDIKDYLLLREILAFLGLEGLDNILCIYETVEDSSVLFRYFEIHRRGICGIKKSNEKAINILRRIELLGGEAAESATKMKMKMRGF